ncbi:MAG: MFS transporter [Ktedonobacteraceae bacterium]|nr:MFS transporter [Ktedonobacteraceae bacterium]
MFLRGTFLPSRLLKRHIMIEVLDGLRFLRGQRMLWVIGLMAAVINACWSGYVAILVLYAVAPGPVGLTPFSYGILLMGEGAGGVVGALLAIPVQRWLGRRWAIGLNILGNAAMFAAPALTTNAWLIGGAALLGGLVGPMWTIAAASLLGRVVPTVLQGRVNAAYRFLGEGLAAIGPLLGGLLAQVFGLRAAFAVCALLTLLMIVPFFYVITEEAMRQAHAGG